MHGRDFVKELLRRGFVIKRRSRSFVWIARADQLLMLDEEATVPDTVLAGILGRCSLPPPSARISVIPLSTTRPVTRPSGRPSGRPSARPSGRPSRSP